MPLPSAPWPCACTVVSAAMGVVLLLEQDWEVEGVRP